MKYGKLHEPSPSYFVDMELCDINLEQYIYRKQEWNALRILSPDSKYFTIESNSILKFMEILAIGEQIVSGIAHIHDVEEVHRDLKPTNGDPSKLFANMK